MPLTKAIYISLVTSILGMPANFAEISWEESQHYNVNPRTIAAIMHTETGGTYNPRAYNKRTGTIGLMQIAPYWRTHWHLTKRQLYNPKINIRTGVRIYSGLKRNFMSKCLRLYPRRLCQTRIIPLHFYRCNMRSALTKGCRRSVRSVIRTRQRIE